MRSILLALAAIWLAGPAAADTAEAEAPPPGDEAPAPKAPVPKKSKMVTGPAFVHDGDTIYIGGKGHRLFGISAPEMDMPGGLEARTVLDDLLAEEGAVVNCTLTGRKTFNRPVAICTAGGRDLAAAVLAAGRAVTWRSYLHGRGSTPEIAADYLAAEAAARSAALGLWRRPSDAPPEPWLDVRVWQIVAAFFGFFAAAWANYAFARRRDKEIHEHDREVLARSLLSELVTLKTGYTHASIRLYHWASGRMREHRTAAGLEAAIPLGAPIYEANLDKLGILGAEPAKNIITCHGALARLSRMVTGLKAEYGGRLLEQQKTATLAMDCEQAILSVRRAASVLALLLGEITRETHEREIAEIEAEARGEAAVDTADA